MQRQLACFEGGKKVRAVLRGLELAGAHLERRELAEALAALDAAELAGCDANACSGSRWMVAMLRGEMAAAWRESDALRRRGAADPHRMWNGEALCGRRVMVRCLHGFGDAVQMLRYAPRLREIAAEVAYEVPPRLLPLAMSFAGVDRVITWGNGAPVEAPVWDVQVEVVELPYLFRTEIEELPIAREYCGIGDREVEAARAAMGARTGLRVGVVWTAGEWNPARSIPAMLIERLVGLGGVEWWSLEGGVERVPAGSGAMRDATAECGDGLVALGAVIANLDLVITVDTLAAHLAGAMGRRVWVMLQYAADWRWMTGRSDSPWYPTMRLFRQASPGDWEGVIDAVREALQDAA